MASHALTARLQTIEGVDAARGLALFDGQAAIYRRVLHRFASTYAGGLPQVLEALAAGSIAELVAAAHSLRGASASIGASQIEAAAAEVEAFGASRAMDAEVARAAAALQALLRRTVDALRRTLDEESPPAS